MKKRKLVMPAAVLLASGVIFTGCGNKIPQMNEEQAQEVSEYAAGLLLKYDANHKSRLVDLALYDAMQQPEPEEPAAPPEEPQGGMPPVADTPVVSVGEGTVGGPAATLEQAIGLAEGITVVYQGDRVADSYPDTESGDAYFALDAAEGKKLLVMEFLISNQTQEEQSLDIFFRNLVFHVTINGSYERNTLVTMLEDDLSTYIGTVPAGGTDTVVLLAEIDSDMSDSITSVALNIKSDAKTSTIQLK